MTNPWRGSKGAGMGPVVGFVWQGWLFLGLLILLPIGLANLLKRH